MGLELGDVIDNKYRIIRLLGEGGMGAVYEGENTRIHRKVAIKILHSSVADSDDAVQRFEREAQAAGRIGSEHIVEVLDLGDLPSGDRYMVMEYLDGEALNDRIKNAGQLSAQATASLVIEMLEGLKAAHAAGIIHRDLKPDNIFLLANKGGHKDFVKIVDFGISKFSSLGGEFSMTRTGAVMGTPYYLSPEQAKGQRDLDHRADLYAVGVILYEACAGKVPFDGETFNELLFKIVLEPIPPLANSVEGIDPHFATIVEKSMARDPAHRYQSAEEMQQALQGWLSGQPPAPELAQQAANATAASAANAAAATANAATAIGGMTPTGLVAPPGTQIGGTVQGATATRTHGAWANTNNDAGSGGENKKWIIAAAAAIILVGGGAFAMMNASNAADTKAAAQAAAQAKIDEKSRADEAFERDQEVAQLQAEKARAEADRAKADQARSEAENATAQVKLDADKRAAKRAEDEKAALEAATKRQRAAPRPRKSPAPRPASTGRRIRTDL